MRPHVVHWLAQFLPADLAALIAPTWFTCVGLAGLVALCAMLAIARRERIDGGIVASAVLWCYVAAVAAGIVVPMTIDAFEQLATTGHVQLRWAGMTSFWGYLAGIAAVAAVCKRHGIALARFGDLATAPLGVALAFARCGCFLAGCDYGKVSALPWAVRFPAGSPAWHDQIAAGLLPPDRLESLPVHPTELYEAVLGLAITALALACRRARWPHGRVFLLGAAAYALGRIGIEMLRGDVERGIYLGLSSGQIFSLLVLAVIAAGLAGRRRLVAATASVATLVLLAASAHAQPAPQPYQPPPYQPPGGSPQPYPPQPYPPQPYPAQPYPAQPYPPQTYPAPPVYTGEPTPPQPTTTHTDHLQVGVLAGLAMPLNRRADQVSTLSGGSLSVGYAFAGYGAWLDLDSYANTDARHGTLLVSAGATSEPTEGLHIGGRLGIGATLVNFKEPAFRDVTGTAVRAEAIVEYGFAHSWAVLVRPLTIDVLTAPALGGAIATWQSRIGIAYQFGIRR